MSKTPVQLMTYILKPMKIKIYSYGFPSALKQKLVELALAVKPNLDYEKYQLPLCTTMRKICENWLYGLVEVRPMSKHSDDSKWLVSLEEIKTEYICQYLHAATDSYYLSKIKTELAKQKLEEFKQAIKPELFTSTSEEIVIIDENKRIANNYAYSGFSLKLMDLLVGKSINLCGRKLLLRRSGRTELMSEPFQNDIGDLYSYVFNFDLQTTPPNNCQILLLTVSTRRFRTRSEDAKTYLKNDMSVYIKATNENYQRVSLQKVKIDDEWTQVWNAADKLCCIFNGFGNIPDAHDVFTNVGKYCRADQQQILCTMSSENDYASESSVGTGVSFVEKKAIYEQIYGLICEMVDCSSKIYKAVDPMRHFKAIEDNFYTKVRKQLALNICANQLLIEIYYFDINKSWANEIEEAVLDVIGTGETLDDILKVDVTFKKLSDYALPVPRNEYDKLKQARINEIIEAVGYADERIPTGAIILLDRQDDNVLKDIKGLLRCAFAKTSRITQFIIPKDDEHKRQDAKEEAHKHKIKVAVYDLFRQLGLTIPVKWNRNLSVCPVIGLFAESKVKSIFGQEVRGLPFTLTFDVCTGKIVVESPLFYQGMTLPYYKACLELCKFSMDSECEKKVNLAKRRFVEQKVKGLENYYREKEGVLIVACEGIIRNEFWPGISNKKIESYDYSLGQYHPEKVDIGEKGMLVSLNLGNSKLRIIRIRTGKEVPDYFSAVEGTEQPSTSGIYVSDKVFYSIVAHPNNKEYIFSYKKSHFDNLKFGFKERNLIEYFPVMLQEGDCATDYINFIDELRWLSPQFKNATNYPVPIHYLMLLKEYFEVD